MRLYAFSNVILSKFCNVILQASLARTGDHTSGIWVQFSKAWDLTYISVQQNFKLSNPGLHWTPRLRSVWLYRNVFILLFLRKQLMRSNAAYKNLSVENYGWEYLANYFLTRKLHYVLSHIYQKPYGIVSSNWTKGCAYGTIQKGIEYLDNLKSDSEVRITIKRRWYVRYTKPQGLLGIFISKKIYKIELIKFLQLLLFSWRSLNSANVYYSGYPIITKSWLPVRFLGNYYFKLLNF